MGSQYSLMAARSWQYNHYDSVPRTQKEPTALSIYVFDRSVSLPTLTDEAQFCHDVADFALATKLASFLDRAWSVAVAVPMAEIQIQHYLRV